MNRAYIVLLLIIAINMQTYAQKVGLVFSGGGSKGLAHIGVLKALEENHIPIDYITGTSMGAIVGAMYASGYTVQEIEKIALSDKFQDWVNGKYQSDYSLFFKKTELNPSIITAKMAVDTSMRFSFRPTLVNDIPLNFALLELFSPASAVAKGDFNHLMIPYRCMASDVLSHEAIMLKKGSLAEAVRASMTVPLVYRPIKIEDKFVFDGGIYNNFPADVMKDEFSPDIIIGSNVSSNTFHEYPKDDERLMNRFFMYMLLGKSDSTLLGKNGIYIEPDLSNYSATNFVPVKELIQQGYIGALKKIELIKLAIKRRISNEELSQKRTEFNNQKKELIFSKIVVKGVNSQQKKYIERMFKIEKGVQSLNEVKRAYYKLVADELFESVYPRITYDRESKSYHFEIWAQIQKKLKIELGGNISTRPISNIFLGVQLNHLNRKAYTLGLNLYSGRFYESIQSSFRIDYPTKLPFYIAGNFTYNHWNYYNTSSIFVENPSITYIDQYDKKLGINLGISLNRNAVINLNSSFINYNDSYLPDDYYLPNDIFDNNSFSGFRTTLSFEKNSLNRKQYANSGQHLLLNLNLYNGIDTYTPGNFLFNHHNVLNIPTISKMKRKWLSAKFSYDYYFLHTKKYSLGYLAEVLLSNQNLGFNYYSTLLSSPAFFPLQDSKSIFFENFRAHQYAAGGLKNVLNLNRKFELRLEAYFFLPYQEFKQIGYQNVGYQNKFSKLHYAGTAGLVYQSPLGPVSLSYNYYDDHKRKHGLLFHLGYLIYNKRAIE